ncbi:hypothetical protein [Sphingomonas sp. BK235]|uniref:hypothetical protein n=1 Tax=Sphingomonas sp. BK235 TaxID=2512131 RepID=UPI0010520946|nr:hypothetical protein [Sphingomonas sp. BK235]TCP35958.1 hypothetical protein EV292_102548 [Sphingomonas sp. BK235]
MIVPPNPARAVRYLLAALLAAVVAALAPVLGGRVERALLYLLLLRRTLDGARPTPVLGLSEALGMPFETARRHVAALGTAGWCRRVGGGIVVAGSPLDHPVLAAALTRAHDLMVATVERAAALVELPAAPPPAARDYDWATGLCVVADLTLAAAVADLPRLARPLDRVLVAALLGGNAALLLADAALARRSAALDTPPAAALLRPVRARAVAAALHLPEATVRRRLVRVGAALVITPTGLIVAEPWLVDAAGRAAAESLHVELRRQLAALARHNFPFAAPALAYRAGTPAPLALG